MEIAWILLPFLRSFPSCGYLLWNSTGLSLCQSSFSMRATTQERTPDSTKTWAVGKVEEISKSSIRFSKVWLLPVIRKFKHEFSKSKEIFSTLKNKSNDILKQRNPSTKKGKQKTKTSIPSTCFSANFLYPIRNLTEKRRKMKHAKPMSLLRTEGLHRGCGKRFPSRWW